MHLVSSVLSLLVLGFAVLAAEPAKAGKGNPRDVLEGWIAAALAGKTEDAAKLADPKSSLGTEKQERLFKRILDGKTPTLAIFLVSQKRGEATAITEEVRINDKPGRPNKG